MKLGVARLRRFGPIFGGPDQASSRSFPTSASVSATRDDASSSRVGVAVETNNLE
jgi:hypothetical protein